MKNLFILYDQAFLLDNLSRRGAVNSYIKPSALSASLCETLLQSASSSQEYPALFIILITLFTLLSKDSILNI